MNVEDCAFMDSVEEAPMDAILGMNLLVNLFNGSHMIFW